MKWSIITDSSCDYTVDGKISDEIDFLKVPFIISVGEKDYVDTASLDVPSMIDDMEGCPEASHTSCPSPGAWYELFEQSENIIAITISSNLSGSYNSALSAREMILEDYPEKNIFVLDSRSAGSALTMYVEKAVQLIESGNDFDALTSELTQFVKRKHTIFALASFGNLVKNGRMSRIVGAIAGKLGIWGIGIGNADGKIVMKEKVRGLNKIIASFLNDMKENGFKHGTVVISHCQNIELAEKLRDYILANWEDVKVKILPVGGLCSYYAERKGLIVAY